MLRRPLESVLTHRRETSSFPVLKASTTYLARASDCVPYRGAALLSLRSTLAAAPARWPGTTESKRKRRGRKETKSSAVVRGASRPSEYYSPRSLKIKYRVSTFSKLTLTALFLVFRETIFHPSTSHAAEMIYDRSRSRGITRGLDRNLERSRNEAETPRRRNPWQIFWKKSIVTPSYVIPRTLCS